MRSVSGLLCSFLCCGALHAGGKTPEEAFTALQDAHKKSGAKGFLPFVTKDSQKTLAGGMVLTLYGVRSYYAMDKEAVEQLKTLDALMKRHGLDAKKLKALAEKDKGAKTADAAVAGLISLSEQVKDSAAFIVDVTETLARLGDARPIDFVPAGAVVKDVKVSGEVAKGVMHYKDAGEDRAENVFFRREAGAWRLDFLPSIRETFEKGKK